MTEFLLKQLSGGGKAPTSRERYGTVAGVLGIISNAIISVMKLTLGLFLNNIAILADGINNLTDAASSVIAVIGFKVSSKPADKEHPFGHARMEYVAALGVSFIVLFLGLQLLMQSLGSIMNPTPPEYGALTVVILIFSIAVKLWQCRFFSKAGKIIGSKVLSATSIDSRNDVIISLVVLISLPLSDMIGFSLEGIAGTMVSLFILYSGAVLINETVTPLLGAPPEKKLIEDISRKILNTDGVIDIHDLIVHNYGVGRYFASVHVEMSADGDLLASHEVIDGIEQEVKRLYDVTLVIHLDPVVNDERVEELKTKVVGVMQGISPTLSIHDFRAVFGPSKTKIIFDVKVPSNFKMTNEELKKGVIDLLTKEIDNSTPVVFIDRYFV